MSSCRLAYLLILGMLAGCTSMPSYRLLRSAPHKDVIQYLVYLPERTGAEIYQRIALDEVMRIHNQEGGRQFPLYEVRFEFRRDSAQGEILARVMVTLDSRQETMPEYAKRDPPKIETILY